jgi:hypothetical protein
MTDCGESVAWGVGGLTVTDPVVLLLDLPLFVFVVLLAELELELEPPPKTRLKNPGRPLDLLGAIDTT